MTWRVPFCLEAILAHPAANQAAERIGLAAIYALARLAANRNGEFCGSALDMTADTCEQTRRPAARENVRWAAAGREGIGNMRAILIDTENQEVREITIAADENGVAAALGQPANPAYRYLNGDVLYANRWAKTGNTRFVDTDGQTASWGRGLIAGGGFTASVTDADEVRRNTWFQEVHPDPGPASDPDRVRREVQRHEVTLEPASHCGCDGEEQIVRG